ncbi:MAG: glycoside hydrolase family 25 protein [Lachnospiraceae bacterium]|nr:glycoside hydrolase family 25 protein [Lachnospiraceae bacterium]
MSMFDDDSYKEGVNVGKRIAIGSIVASLAVLAILAGTVAMNNKKRPNNNNQNNPYIKATEETTEEEPASNNRRTSDELSFWDMYDDKDEEEENIVVSENKAKDKQTASKNKVNKTSTSRNSTSKNSASADRLSVSLNGESVSGNKFNISPEGAEPELVPVNALIPKNELIEDNFSVVSGNKLTYSQSGRNVSHFGIDVSKYNGTVSWNSVKKAGVEYALLRVGARGYSSGNIVLDEKFTENLKGCQDNGIDVGVYFFSQAINTNEAIEEASYCVASLSGNRIRYPIIFDSEEVLNDSYRTENLSSTELTNIFKAFAEVVKAYGYTPMFAGTKKQLARRVDLQNMNGYDIWLLDTGEKTEYPYRYSIRQYSDKGKVDGITGEVNLDICLISYAEK